MFDSVAAAPRVGKEAGWYLSFRESAERLAADHALGFGAADYDAEISASMPGQLEGGSYRFVIEGITTEHHDRLAQAWSKAPGNLLVDLYLYWRDLDAGSFLGSLTSRSSATAPHKDFLAARLVVTRLSRRAGTRRYEAVIEAREWVFEALSRPLGPDVAAGADLLSCAVNVGTHLGVEVQAHADAALLPADPVPVAPAAGTIGVTALKALDAQLSEQTQRGGRGMFLIRDGMLHVGPARIPLSGQEPREVDDAGGLVHVEYTGHVAGDWTDPTLGGQEANQQVQLIMLGRPDIKPGDLVRFPAPPGTPITTPASFGEAVVAVLQSVVPGSSGVAEPITLQAYVCSVSHQLSRVQGFVTTVAAVTVREGDFWEKWTPEGSVDPQATPEGRIASAVAQLRHALESSLEVGEVRAAVSASTSEPPSQTVDVWMGLGKPDGLPFGARRLPIDRQGHSRLSGLPYLTPFAWGRCGLVLPRYPGTRVMVGHRNGGSNDPVDLGALWESGRGPDSQAGDWWLSLPAAVPAAARSSVSDASLPAEPGTHASNDLTDADGARVIEVGRLTIRVLPSNLPEPGKRPSPPSDSKHHLRIEHQSGSYILIDDKGDVTIHSAAAMTLDAAGALTINAEEVKVRVKPGKTMDVDVKP